MSLPKAYTVWLGCLWLLIAFAAICSLALPHSFVLTVVGDSIQCILLLSFSISALINLRQNDRRTRLFWMLITSGAALWVSTQVLWTHFEVFFRRDVPNPFVGDIILFLHLVPLMGAMALQPDVDRGSQNTRLGSFDLALLFLWWLYLYLFIVIPWQYVAPDAKLYGITFDTLYFAEHIVLLFAVAVAWRRSRGSWRQIYGSFFAATCLYAFSSICASVAIDFSTYYTGSFYDMPLLASMVLFTRAALIARAAGDVEPSKLETKSHNWISALAMAVAGSLPLLALWDVLFNNAPPHVRSFRLLLTLIAIVFIGGLRSWKQFVLDEELDHANNELREASITDALTGVRNRRFLATTIDNDVRLVLRAYSSEKREENQNRDLIFYLVDIDHFKSINDQFGHDQGDDLLVEIAARISSAIRHSDVLIRWGGEEFLIVSRYTNRADAETLASRVLHAVGSQPLRLGDGQRLRRTCSLGWAAFPWYTGDPDAVSHEEILRLADSALYQAKRSGRNRAVGLLPTEESTPETTVSGANLPCRTVITFGPADAAVEDAAVPAK